MLAGDGKPIDLGEYKGSAFARPVNDEPVKLGSLQGVNPADCELRLIGGDNFDQIKFTLVPGDDAASGVVRWSCLANDLRRGDVDVRVADFDIAPNGQLRFRWRHGASASVDPKSINLLCNCVLEIQAKKPPRHVVLPLRQPLIIPPVAVPETLFNQVADLDSVDWPLPIKFLPRLVES